MPYITATSADFLQFDLHNIISKFQNTASVVVKIEKNMSHIVCSHIYNAFS
jgi:hypothetical protein